MHRAARAARGRDRSPVPVAVPLESTVVTRSAAACASRRGSFAGLGGGVRCRAAGASLDLFELGGVGLDDVDLPGLPARSVELVRMPPEYRGEKYLKTLWIELA